MNLDHIKRALKFVWASSSRWTIYLFIVQLFQATLPLVLLYVIKLIVDALSGGLSALSLTEILYFVLAFGAIQLVLAIVENYQLLISETQRQLVTDYMSTIAINKAVEMDLSYYENPAYHDTLHRAQTHALYRPVQILRNLTDLLKNIFLLASIGGLLILLHWGVAAMLIVFALPIAAVRWHYSKKLFVWEKERTNSEREANYLNRVLTTDTYAKEVRIFDLGALLLNKFIQVRKKLFTEKYNINHERAKVGVLARTIEILAMTAAYGYIVYSTYHGHITIGDLVMYFQAFQKGQAAIQQALNSLVELDKNRLFLTHLFELLEVKSLLPQSSHPIPVQKLQEGLRVESVSFSYPSYEVEALKNVNLNLEKGKVIAIVGENGSGKTTLIKLLCRLYDPTKGDIYWDNKNFKNLNLNELRQRISVIYQDFAKFYFNVNENIKIGQWRNKTDHKKIEAAADKSDAKGFIEELPEQYNQMLGRRFKDGVELSGGQWQKIALSRAFYKEADIIILDEPSSAIDPLAEAEIFRQFRDIAKDKILILITHRLYNLKLADKIIVLKEGQIIESGSHKKLIDLGGYYKLMFQKQAHN